MLTSSEHRFAVLGAGDAGLALAATLALRSCDVTLFSRSAARLQPLVAGDVDLLDSRGSRHRVRIGKITTDLSEALRASDVVLVATNSTAHREIATRVARLIRAEQIVVLVPGHTGGALEFAHAFASAGGDPRVVVGETQALPFVCRSAGPGAIHVLQEKAGVRVASLPGSAAAGVAAALSALVPSVQVAPSVLWTSFDNLTAVVQAPLLLVNAARVENGGAFRIYRDGISPAVGRLMEGLDAERLAVAADFGVACEPGWASLRASYGAEGEDLYRVILGVDGYANVSAPSDLRHRFLVEHVPMGLVPMAALAEVVGRCTPRMNGVIELASALLGFDLRAQGRTLDRIGLEGLSRTEIIDLAQRARPRAKKHPTTGAIEEAR
jgi:opine dehydrogenase